MRNKNINNSRPCSACGKILPADSEHFYRKKNGILSSECRDCFRQRSSRNQKTCHHAGGADYHLSYIMRGTRQRARKAGLECEIDTEFLKILLKKQTGLCAITKVPLTFTKGLGHAPTNASIDRIDPTKGYIKDNIQLVAYRVNIMKSNLSIDELVAWCALIVKEGPWCLGQSKHTQDKVDHFDSNKRCNNTTNPIG